MAAVTVSTPDSSHLPQGTDGLPTLCGWEAEINAVTLRDEPVCLTSTNLRLRDISAGFAIGLHMHQPTIPAGVKGALINNLQYMFEHPYEGDNHDAGPFAYCYARMGDFIPELVGQGCNPRVMLDYSGTLLWGFQQMRRDDILGKLRQITCDPTYQPYVEWLGTFWGHTVAASTPIPDIKLHIQAWQHHFASLFGLDALKRVKGFSLPEMQLPSHPDTLYALVQALRDCGYRWLIIQEHTVETLTGDRLGQPHVPHRLIARNTQGETVSITALIKTQGSDTKLIGQMQPYYEAKTLNPVTVGGIEIPPLVTQISDGENGGVMMNEFPGAFKRAWHEMRHQGNGRVGTVGLNGTEYLELMAAAGIQDSDLPPCQAIGQHRLWQHLGTETSPPEQVAAAIATLHQEDARFSMEGSSWTNDRSWVQGYDNILQPMERLSARFHAAIAATPASLQANLPLRPAYRQALLYNLLLQTSCFRYWGQGTWTDYAQAIYHQGLRILQNGFG
jgi:hypothetical protein